MEFGLQTRGSYPYVREAAQWAQSRQLANFALPDHYLAGRSPTGEGYDTRSADIYPYLGGLARETDSIELSALVSPVTYRHPAALLKLGLAVDEMSGGRFTLGVGTGWMRAEHEMFGLAFPEWEERFDRLEEALGYLSSALGDGSEGFHGEYYQLEPVEHQPKGTNLRIMVGGSGPKRTPDLAGRFADEFNIYSQPPDGLAVRIERARKSAVAAGRDPDSIVLSSVSPPVVGPDEATYRTRLEALAAARGMEVDKLEKGFRDMSVPMGTHEEARDTFGPLAGLGITRYYLQIIGSFDLDYAEELLEVLG
ncbi:MAG: LLM class flavin-dependent oxidoreductase [Acidimicrobiia bacterium]|nr:LLM class flavin-dependent oxidoreductase [Acidimicrobiia bacterium]